MTSPFGLIQVVQHLSFCHDLAEIMSVLRKAARELTGADGVTIVLRQDDQCYYAEENAIGPLWKGRRFPISTCISGWCMLHGEQVIVSDIYADSRIPHDAYRPTFVQSLAMAPIRTADPIGAIGAYWAQRHHASPEEMQILQSLGDSASVALANVQLIEELRQSNRRKDEFVSMLAHELRNPLAPIQNSLQILRHGSLDAASTGRAHEIMERQLGHLTKIIDDLLDMSRLARGTISLRTERIDLVAIVRHCAEDFRDGLKQAGLGFDVQLPDVPIWVQGDRTRLSQILGNLLQNAEKFTPRGGAVTMRLASDPRTQEAVISVSDTGVGITAELLPHVFEVFAQADKSLDRSRGGLGLGLSIARQLAILHGGTIEAHSAGADRGAEFRVRIPCKRELAALAGKAVAPQKTAAKRRVLVVEDNRDSAETMRILLELLGHEVSVAYDGRQGVELAKSVRPAVVLCDIGLPVMDGLAVASALRSDPLTAEAHLIAVTGYGGEDDRQRTLAAGFDAHLVKPVDVKVLVAQIDSPRRAPR